MKTYRVKEEYADLWNDHSDSTTPVIVDEEEISRLASEWGVDIDTLMKQVEEI